jgi:hypothetical protein
MILNYLNDIYKLILLMFYFSRSENIQERSARFTSGLPKKRQVTFIVLFDWDMKYHVCQ